MKGRQDRDQRHLLYEFGLDEMIPADHLLRRIDDFATAVLGDLHEQLPPIRLQRPARKKRKRSPESKATPPGIFRQYRPI